MAKAKAKTFVANGNWGELVCDIATGNVVEYRRGGDWEKQGDGYDNITRLDADEWRATYPGGDIAAGHDILDFGSWDKAGLYVGPESDWRFSMWQDRESYGGEWRIVPRLGDKAKADYAAWLKEQQGNGHASEALDMLESRR
ncbi:hypothetical protein ABIF78_007695 [Bradyrhizobium japonicum]